MKLLNPRTKKLERSEGKRVGILSLYHGLNILQPLLIIYSRVYISCHRSCVIQKFFIVGAIMVVVKRNRPFCLVGKFVFLLISDLRLGDRLSVFPFYFTILVERTLFVI